ncbi:MAG: SoxR reducing system RseC family protein [bacterium]
MTTEEGTVIEIDDSIAWIKIIRTASCKGCSAKIFCISCEQENQMKVKALNTLGARVGDKVVIGIETSSYIKISLLIYLFPILCLIAGAIIGEIIASDYSVNPSLLSALFGFLLFFLSFVIVKLTAHTLAKKKEYRPEIIKIITD